MTEKKGKVLIVNFEVKTEIDLSEIIVKAGYELCGIASSVEHMLAMIDKNRPSLVLVNLPLTGKQVEIDFVVEMEKQNIGLIYVLSNANESVIEKANTPQSGTFLIKPFCKEDVLFALENARYLHFNKQGSVVSRQMALQNSLLYIIGMGISRNEKLIRIATAFQEYIPFDYLSGRPEYGFNQFGEDITILRVGIADYQILEPPGLAIMMDLEQDEMSNARNSYTLPMKKSLFSSDGFTRRIIENSFDKLLHRTFGLQSMLSIPILTENYGKYIFSFMSRHADIYTSEHLLMLDQLELSFTRMTYRILDNNLPVNRIAPTDTPLIRKEISDECLHIDKIIGSSAALKEVLYHVHTVAPYDLSVLLLGESGTGKERIALSIHDNSARRNRPFIKVNCATLPPNLFEYDLFSYENGRLTGTVEKNIGKFEQAKGGTIFLDDISEISLDCQVKLLKALQDMEIEKLTWKQGLDSIKMDVRIIAATNRDLQADVVAGIFRVDLYQKLNIYPILLPPLRTRKEDIPELTRYFIQQHLNKMKKGPITLSDYALKQLSAYNWPGNIRELENLLERAIIMNDDGIINHLPIDDRVSAQESKKTKKQNYETIQKIEKEYIADALRRCSGKIGGVGGAAELLQIPPSTLISKIKKMNIIR